jgi:hypothetical protein
MMRRNETVTTATTNEEAVTEKSTTMEKLTTSRTITRSGGTLSAADQSSHDAGDGVDGWFQFLCKMLSEKHLLAAYQISFAAALTGVLAVLVRIHGATLDPFKPTR